jgi:hypothetical protein
MHSVRGATFPYVEDEEEERDEKTPQLSDSSKTTFDLGDLRNSGKSDSES